MFYPQEKASMFQVLRLRGEKEINGLLPTSGENNERLRIGCKNMS